MSQPIGGLARPFRPVCMDTPQEDQDALAALVLKAASHAFPVVVEVGSYVGRTALVMADAGAFVYCVDHWQGSDGDMTRWFSQKYTPEGLFAAFIHNVGHRLYEDIFVCPGPSLFWAEHFPLQPDMVFLDAGHKYEDIKADIAAWLPRVKKGGILAGHDYSAQFPGVARAVDELGGCQTVGRCVWWKRV